MAIPRIANRWLRLPGRIALILGLGALSTAGARADSAQADGSALGNAMVRTEGGKIYLSEGGRETELRLSATPQRDHLLRLLEEHGPAGIKLDHNPRLIMSGGGGTGFYWWGSRKPISENPAPALQNPPQAPTQPRLDPGANQGRAPRDNDPPNDRKG
jgi:hypothetical protein